MLVNHRHRQYLQHLRNGQWVKAASLPDSKQLVARMLDAGWIEAQGTGKERAYRITTTGLDAMKLPVRLYNGVNKLG